MSWKQFSEDCPGCKPVALDVKTMKPLDPGSPMARAIELVWAGASRAEKEAFHRCTCLNSINPMDRLIMFRLTKAIQEAAEAAAN